MNYLDYPITVIFKYMLIAGLCLLVFIAGFFIGMSFSTPALTAIAKSNQQFEESNEAKYYRIAELLTYVELLKQKLRDEGVSEEEIKNIMS